jgi:hypothetical protein
MSISCQRKLHDPPYYLFVMMLCNREDDEFPSILPNSIHPLCAFSNPRHVKCLLQKLFCSSIRIVVVVSLCVKGRLLRGKPSLVLWFLSISQQTIKYKSHCQLYTVTFSIFLWFHNNNCSRKWWNRVWLWATESSVVLIPLPNMDHHHLILILETRTQVVYIVPIACSSAWYMARNQFYIYEQILGVLRNPLENWLLPLSLL